MKKVGIIGCGNIANVHGWVLQKMEHVSIAVACDVQEEKARCLAQQYGSEDTIVCTDWHELCELELDVLHICTPHFLHAPMAVELLRSGKAVFMEKPCAISRQQFEELKQVEAEHIGKLGFCFQNRYNETTRLVDRLIAQGKIGNITGARAFVTWCRDESYYKSSNWKGMQTTEGGGSLINQAIHTLDLLLRYLGEPLQVEATVSNHHLKGMIEVEDTVEAWMAFENGKRGCFYSSNGYVTDASVFLEIHGESGSIRINGSEVTLRMDDLEPKYFMCERNRGIGKGYWGCGHEACIKDFYQCLEHGTVFQGDIKGVENTFETMMRIYEMRS